LSRQIGHSNPHLITTERISSQLHYISVKQATLFHCSVSRDPPFICAHLLNKQVILSLKWRSISPQLQLSGDLEWYSYNQSLWVNVS